MLADAVVWTLDKQYFLCMKTSVMSFLKEADPCIFESGATEIVIFVTDQFFAEDVKEFMKKCIDWFDFNFEVKWSVEVVSADLPADERLSPASSVRLKVPKILKGRFKKILYVDCDTMFVSDPIELLDFDLGIHAIAAKRDLEALYWYSWRSFAKIGRFHRKDMVPYFNSGVLVIDVEEAIPFFDKAEEVLRKKKCKHGDQDALNIIFNDDYAKLPCKCNFFTERDDTYWGFTDEPVLVHFIMSRNKPWSPDFIDNESKWNGVWLALNEERASFDKPYKKD